MKPHVKQKHVKLGITTPDTKEEQEPSLDLYLDTGIDGDVLVKARGRGDKSDYTLLELRPDMPAMRWSGLPKNFPLDIDDHGRLVIH